MKKENKEVYGKCKDESHMIDKKKCMCVDCNYKNCNTPSDIQNECICSKINEDRNNDMINISEIFYRFIKFITMIEIYLCVIEEIKREEWEKKEPNFFIIFVEEIEKMNDIKDDINNKNNDAIIFYGHRDKKKKRKKKKKEINNCDENCNINSKYNIKDNEEKVNKIKKKYERGGKKKVKIPKSNEQLIDECLKKRNDLMKNIYDEKIHRRNHKWYDEKNEKREETRKKKQLNECNNKDYYFPLENKRNVIFLNIFNRYNKIWKELINKKNCMLELWRKEKWFQELKERWINEEKYILYEQEKDKDKEKYILYEQEKDKDKDKEKCLNESGDKNENLHTEKKKKNINSIRDNNNDYYDNVENRLLKRKEIAWRIIIQNILLNIEMWDKYEWFNVLVEEKASSFDIFQLFDFKNDVYFLDDNLFDKDMVYCTSANNYGVMENDNDDDKIIKIQNLNEKLKNGKAEFKDILLYLYTYMLDDCQRDELIKEKELFLKICTEEIIKKEEGNEKNNIYTHQNI
ncbi:hypothetical protein PFMALIP_00127 [Plasmodium falciparum MaliPS096_E11]|uniref:Uncharacterized protein n=1 Tax=Plasmodium falciparum MaliPS096_E11 TaxID=1036727 RepID=A0A024WY57_PLAFA|nr:hypothetical protein PFMALIP_00127 [Plasmodium falciparum MaliPS096_E11]